MKKPLPARADFIVFLQTQVIPDLLKLGAPTLVGDFETAIRFMEDEDRLPREGEERRLH
jgi:hypothetical protein